MITQLSYQQLVDQVNLFLDNQLSPQEKSNFLNQVQSNPLCRQLLESEKEFRSYLKENTPKRGLAPHVLQSIKSKIDL